MQKIQYKLTEFESQDFFIRQKRTIDSEDYDTQKITEIKRYDKILN